MKRYLWLLILLVGCSEPESKITFDPVDEDTEVSGFVIKEKKPPEAPKKVIPPPKVEPKKEIKVEPKLQITKPKPVTVESEVRLIIKPEAAAQAQRILIEVMTGEDHFGKGWCANCNADKAVNKDGDSRIELKYAGERACPEDEARGYPVYVWTDDEGVIHTRTGRHDLNYLYSLVEQSNAPKPKVKFGNSRWYEERSGTTSIEHLMSKHGLTWEQVAPYAHDQKALDLIHGWKHTGQGYSPPGSTYKVESHRKYAATGEVGAFSGGSKIAALRTWINNNVGQGRPITLEWMRNGGQITPLLSGTAPTIEHLIGTFGKVKLSVPESNMPVKRGFLNYERQPDGTYDISFGTNIALNSLKVSGSSEEYAQKVSLDPITLWNVFSLGKTIWSAFHPECDLTIGGHLSAITVLKGDVIDVTFKDAPAIKLKWVFKFNLGVKHVTISPKLVHIDFIGSNWIKSREFSIIE